MILRNFVKGILFLIFISGTIRYADCQNVRRFRHLTINNGLAHTDATCFEQDAAGFIWIGTNSGLQRFDGRLLKTFQNELFRFNKVYNNRITALKVTGDTLWVGSEGGLSAFNLRREEYIRVGITGDFPEDDLATVTSISVLPGMVCFIASGTLYYSTVGIQGNELIVENLLERVSGVPEAFRKAQVLSVEAVDPGFILAGTTEGLILFHINSKGAGYLDSYKIKFGNNHISSSPVDDIFLKDNHLWLRTGNSFQALLFDSARGDIKQVIKSLSLSDFDNWRQNDGFLTLKSISDNDENIWCATNDGLYLIEAPVSESPALKHFVSSKYDQFSLRADNLSSLKVDRSNCLWVGTWGGGASYLDLDQKKFNNLIMDPENPGRSLRGSFVRAIAESPDGLIWVGLRNDGINVFNPLTGTCETLEQHYRGNFRMLNDEIRSIRFTGNIAIVGTTTDLSLFDLKRNTTRRIRQGPGNDQISSAAIFSIENDSHGNIWLGTWGAGINRIRFNGNEYEILKLDRNVANNYRLSSDVVTNIYFDEYKNEILASTSRGLNRIILDIDGEISNVIVYHVNESSSSLGSEYLWPLVKENDSVYWAGTLGGGLNRLVLYDLVDENGNGIYRATPFTTKEGAPSDDIESIQIDRDGNLWLGSRGLSRFDISTGLFWNFDINDGLQSNGFKIGASCSCKDGTLYFGGINGLNYFRPDEILENKTSTTPVFSGIRIHNREPQVGAVLNDRVLLGEAIHYTKSIELKYIENDFSISFASLHFANPEKCSYRYKLSEYDNEWIEITGEYPVANYSNLEYGEYVLQMDASNSDGIWSNKPVSLHIIVRPPWWRSTLAYIGYIILLILVIVAVLFYMMRWISLRNNLKMVEAEEKRNEEMHQLKLQFFTNISHEFRTPLTLILSPVEKLIRERNSEKEQRKLLQLINNNADRLLHLVNELMDFRKAETGKMPVMAQKIEAREFISSICQGFVTLAKQKQIKLNFLAGRTFSIWADPEMMSKIIYNLLSNAVKYTNKEGSIDIDLFDGEYKDLKPLYPNKHEIINDPGISGYCFIRIRDTGMGISEGSISHIFERYYQVDKPSSRHLGSGVGLALLKSLVSLHHGYILVSSERYVGTEIIVGFPFGNNHLKPEELVPEGSAPVVSTDYPCSPSQSGVGSMKPADGDEISLESSLLIVEDNIELRVLLADHFRNRYRIFEAGDGQEGYDIAVVEQPSLIISDVMMPVLDGFEMIKLLKQDLRTSHIPIVMLSARASVESQIEGIELGAVEYIPKPFNIMLLDLKVRQFLANLQCLKKKYATEVFAPTRDIVKSEKDQKFLEEVFLLIDRNIDNSDFSIEEIVGELGIGRSNLYKKIKALTDQTLGDFIRTYRLKKAARILLSEDVTVSEVIYRVGINSHSYFTKSFKSHFNMTPSEFIKKNKSPGKMATD